MRRWLTSINAVVTAIVVIFVTWLALVAYVVFVEDGPRTAPFGCAYVDVDPSKTNDIRLACADGYPREN